jgi:uncharacterized protein YciI
MDMIMYHLVILRVGEKWTPEVTPETERIREGHFANIKAMEEMGKLVLAGPFESGSNETSAGDLDGILLLTVGSKEEAQALLQNDPSIASGRMSAEILPWWGPKGITFKKD